MIEPDKWILEHAGSLGVDPALINPASVDIRLGGHVISVDYTHEVEHNLEPGEKFTFIPGRFYLAHTQEIVTIPETHAAQLILKSSSGRKGLDHAHSGWLDPGFSGHVTFEFVAHRPVTFEIGQRIAQIIYMRLTEPPLKAYGATGRYQDQRGATKARAER